jgi:hypothetical protein
MLTSVLLMQEAPRFEARVSTFRPRDGVVPVGNGSVGDATNMFTNP